MPPKKKTAARTMTDAEKQARTAAREANEVRVHEIMTELRESDPKLSVSAALKKAKAQASKEKASAAKPVIRVETVVDKKRSGSGTSFIESKTLVSVDGSLRIGMNVDGGVLVNDKPVSPDDLLALIG